MATRRSKNIPALNLMVAGHARVGKTDFIATLYDTLDIQKLVPLEGSETVPELIFPTNVTGPAPLACKIECKAGNKLLLQLIDSPGLDVHLGMMKEGGGFEKLAHEYLASLLTFIEDQFAKTLNDEAKVKRTKTPDYQVHCCLFFLSPEQVILNKGLSPADKIVLAGLTEKVNVIPCLGKSDLVTVRELRVIQDYLRKDFDHVQIDIYDFGEADEDNSEDDIPYKSMLPFCIVNSEEMANEKGKNREMGIYIENKKVLGREFIWGIIDVQNPDHCGFDALTSIMFETHLEDLRETTRAKYYETWRTRSLRNHKTSVYVPIDLKSFVIEE